VKTVTLIITDTPSHAAYSAKLMKLPIKKYVPLIVSSDEDVFTVNKAPEKSNNDPFTVFYYGLFMTPLQGLDTILAAAVLLKDQAVRFVLLGGKESTQEKIQLAQESGANVVYKRFVPYDALPGYMANADICLGGPFGGTVQAQYVIGGKTYQYMNMGRPVLIGKNEESHIWTDKKDALIVEQANAQALADAIIWAKTHPTEVVKIGKAGRELYEMKLSNAVLAGQLRSLLARKELS
jgi:glycosyltransferase involved in cell wall biosynthesis